MTEATRGADVPAFARLGDVVGLQQVEAVEVGGRRAKHARLLRGRERGERERGERAAELWWACGRCGGRIECTKRLL